MPTLERPDGCIVHFEDSGGSGPALLLGHGFLMDHRSFDQLVEGFPDYRVVRWDLRGHGKTVNSPDEYSFWDQARDGLAIAEHLGLQDAVFGGHSQGGYAALRMALLAPQMCRGLLLFATTDAPYSPEMRDGYRAIFSGWDPGSVRGKGFATTLATTMIGGELDFMRLWRQRWAEHSREGFEAAVSCLVEVDDLRSLTPSINAPALIVRGEMDQAFSDEDVHALADRLGGPAQVEAIPGVTHGAHMTASDEVNRRVRKWLGAL
mgnify:CR=1 FL=1